MVAWSRVPSRAAAEEIFADALGRRQENRRPDVRLHDKMPDRHEDDEEQGGEESASHSVGYLSG